MSKHFTRTDFGDSRRSPEVGEMIPGKGIYIGCEALKDKTGSSLGRFDLYAAPKDLKDDKGEKLLLTFNEAVKVVASLKNLHGHDGGHFGCERELHEAIKGGRYKGEWFIPPLDILKALYVARDKGALARSFALPSGAGSAAWYWSCNESPDDSSNVYAVDFTVGGGGLGHKDEVALSSRVMRAEPRPPA